MPESFAPAVETALARKVGHPQPFSDDELADVESLFVKNTDDLGGLTRLPALRVLIVRGYGRTDLTQVTGLPDLSSLTAEFSAVVDVSVLPQLATNTLVLSCNAIEDLRPALQLRQADLDIDVRGNPLSELSYRQVVPALRERGAKVEVSEERVWLLTRRLYSLGIPFDYYLAPDGNRLCRPGLAFTPHPTWAHPKIDPDDLERLLNTDLESVHALFEREDLF